MISKEIHLLLHLTKRVFIMADLINWFINNKESILAALGAFYALATAIAAITPSDKDDTILGKIGMFFDRVGLNIKGKK